MKKFISFLMCALICVGACASLVACGPEQTDTGDKVLINYVIGDGGFGRAHADDLAEQFMIWAQDKKYGEKTGVVVEVHVEPTANIKSAESQNYHVMNVNCDGPTLADTVRLGYVANVDDVVKENQEMIGGDLVSIESKIPDYARGSYQGDPEADGERDYYAVPGYSYAPGLTFDENSFNKNGYFFAKDSSVKGAQPYYSKLMKKTYYFLEGTGEGFIEPDKGTKSDGPDAKSGTQDDGLPASLVELAVLCEKIKDDDRAPFIACGKKQEYKQFFSQALYIQLMGYQQLYTWMNYDGGPIEVVTGYTNEPLFPGYDDVYDEDVVNTDKMIYKPTTAIVNLTEENGYYSTATYAEYLATAFTQLAVDLEWFHESFYSTQTHEPKDAMRDFVNSGHQNKQEALMLVEMNFWYNEAKTDDIHAEFDLNYNDDGHLGERRITWMSLPTVFDGYTEQQIIEGKKTRQVLYGTNNNGMGIASYVQDDPELFEACKDFLQFYCTDKQMNRWTKEIGIRKTAEYAISEDVLNDLPWYGRKLGELMNTNIDVMIIYAENDTFRYNYNDYVCGYHGSPLQAEVGGVKYVYVTQYFQNKQKTATAKAFFDAGVIDKEGWVAKYHGSKEVAPYTEIGGVEIKFNPVLPV